MIQRDPKYYVTGYEGKDPRQAPFYLRSLVFDGKEGDLNTRLVDTFNNFLQDKKIFSDHCLKPAEPLGKNIPIKIIVINASENKLPTSHETARIFEDFCRTENLCFVVRIVTV